MNKFIFSTLVGIFSLQFAMPGYSQPPNGLPENAKVELKGTLQVFIRENLQTQSASYEYFLERGKGKGPVKLIFLEKHPSQLRSGVGIAVRGMVRNGNVEVTATNFEEGTGDSGSGSGSTQAFTLDQRSALVVIVNVPGFTHSSTDVGNMDNYYFGSSNSMADMYDKITFGQLMISGQVAGAINVSQSAEQVCDTPFSFASSWLTLAENELGINRNDFRHRIFALPRQLSGTGCGWTGYANVGCGSSCTAFNRWSHDINTTSHEFGHNIGLAHAGVGSNQYGDYSSFMGYSLSNGVRALDGAHHWQTGWYEDIDAPSTQTIQSSGTYQVAPLNEVAPSSTISSIYRIEIPAEDDYFLSARVAQGYDSDLSSLNSAALAGVNIHRYAGSGYDQTSRVAQLSDGQTYADSLNSVTITQLSRSSDGTVTFSVDLAEAECVESTPGLSINPSFATVGESGSYNFPITVTNNDSGPCSSRLFTLVTDAGSLTPAGLTVSPGSQGNSSLALNGGSLSGDIVATVSVQGESTPPRNATLTVDATPPTVDAPTGTYTRKGKNHRIELTWSGNDESGISSYVIFRNGASRATTSQNSYTDSLSRTPAASYEYYVQAIDNYGNTTYSTPTTVETGSGDGDDSDGGGGGGNDKPCRGKKCTR